MYIHIKSHPKSKDEMFKKLKESHYEIWLKEPAERNLANKKIIEIIRLNFPNAKKVTLVSGHHSRSKLFSIDFDE